MNNYWIFVTSNQPSYKLTNRDVVLERKNQKFYGLTRISSHQPGDKVLFYLAGDGVFIAEGEISRVLKTLNSEEKEKYWLKNKYMHDFFHATKGVEFKYIKLLDEEVNVQDIKSNLDFIKNSANMGLAFQGRNAKPISEKDYRSILKVQGGIDMVDNMQKIDAGEESPDINKLYKDLREEGRIEFITFHPAYSYEEFIEGITVKTGDENVESENISYKLKPGIFKEMCKRALAAAIKTDLESEGGGEKSWREVYGEYLETLENEDMDFDDAPKYVLIIDEINRGDMAKIFGELITLLEEDKRIGRDNELVVKLPNSGNNFCVPPNLYIIATMNTADRSIALIDVALRRRFGFVPMIPDMDLVRDKVITKLDDNIGSLLGKSLTAIEKINVEIAKDTTIGRDKQIGHSFFFKVKNEEDLAMVWRYEILPLLEEYCYADYGRINELVFGTSDGSNYIEKTMGRHKIDVANLERMLDSINNKGTSYVGEDDARAEE